MISGFHKPPLVDWLWPMSALLFSSHVLGGGGWGEYIYILGQICLAHYSILSACIWCSWIMAYHEVAQLKVCSEGKPFNLSNKNDVAFEHQLCEENNFFSWHCHSLVPFLHFLEPMYIGLQQSISLCRLPRKGSNRSASSGWAFSFWTIVCLLVSLAAATGASQGLRASNPCAI